MLYVIPFGNLLNVNNRLCYDQSENFAAIQESDFLKCGLLIQDKMIHIHQKVCLEWV
jgi:hypothetical protein